MAFDSRTRWRWGAYLGTPLLLLLIYSLQTRIDTQTQSIQQEKEELLLRSGTMLKKASLGYDGLLADIYWTRAVQYYGGKLANRDTNHELLQPLLDLTTTLDPNLLIAYRFGATFLAEPPPIGAGRPEEAVALLHKGISANPDAWILWADLGFLQYWHLRDYQAASAAYIEGSKHAKAGLWMKGMAAKIAEEGGSRQTSRMLWTQVYETSTDVHMHQNALNHLAALKADEDIEHLNLLLADYARRAGSPATSLRDLVRAGMLRGIPVDPANVMYALGTDGKAHLGSESPIKLEILKPVQPRPDTSPH